MFPAGHPCEHASGRAPFIEFWHPGARGFSISFDSVFFNADADTEKVLVPNSNSVKRFHAMSDLVLEFVVINETSGMHDAVAYVHEASQVIYVGIEGG